MGLVIGCYSSGDRTFCTKYDVLINDEYYGRSVLIKLEKGSFFHIHEIPSDCTAASLDTEILNFDSFVKCLPMIIEYLSYNGRISCFFSRKVKKGDINDCLEKLKPFPIMGLHLHKSNRDPEVETYMLTGILKVPNPHINNYTKWAGEFNTEHDHLNTDKFNSINTEFGLSTL